MALSLPEPPPPGTGSQPAAQTGSGSCRPVPAHRGTGTIGPSRAREELAVAEVEIGLGKSGRRAYGFDDIAIVPSRRTRDPEDVDISWEIDAYRFELPLLASAMDGVVSPATAIEIGRLGGAGGARTSKGLWTRYEDPEPLLEEIAKLDTGKATARMQDIYLEPIKPELVTERIRQIRDAGMISVASVTPQRTDQLLPAIQAGELDMLVIQGTVVSAEHVSKNREPLNLLRVIRELRDARDRRRVRQLPGCAAPDAHGRRRRAGRRRARPRVHHPRRARDRRAPGHRHRRRPGRPHAPPRRDRRVRPCDRRRRHGHRRRHRQGHRVRRRRGHDRLAARRRPRGARAGLPLGHGHVPPDAARVAPGCRRPSGARWRRSSSARPTRTTAA